MELSEYGSFQYEAFLYFIISYSIVIFLNIVSILYYIFNTVVSLKVNNFKRNVNRIHQAIYIAFPISSLFLISEKILDFIGMKEDLEKNNQFYKNVQYIRTAILAPPFFSLIIVMLERLCATYYIKDYEKKQRPFIAFSLIFLLYSLGIFTSYIVNFTELFLFCSILHVILNVISYGILLWIYRLNRNYYFENRVIKHTYSLGERYQISENIRVHKYFTRYLFVMAFFIILCGMIIIIGFFTNRNTRRILRTIYDLSYTLLTLFAPYFSLQMSESWQNEFDLILVKIRIRRLTRVNDVSEKSKKLRNTFGEEMNIERGKHSDLYFEHLKRTWK